MLSLYVPIISNSTSEAYIKKMFLINNIGKISRIDFVKNIEKNRREAFIHFEEWFDTKQANSLKEDILNKDTQTRFKYNKSNSFWPLLVNKNPTKTNDNPNYIILDNKDIKHEFKQTLNLIQIVSKKSDNSKIHKA